MLKQYEFNFQMVSGCSTLVQFQAVHEIRALHYSQLKAALPSIKLHFLFILFYIFKKKLKINKNFSNFLKKF